MSKRLYEKLIDIEKEGLYPFHMPGHKRNVFKINDSNGFINKLASAYNIDITEIDGFDNLHDADGIIHEAEVNAAKLYGSRETHFLVNGSSSGILSAISAVCMRGDKIIVARNSHISVFNAIVLNGLNPVYVEPEIIATEYIHEGIQGSISADSIEKALNNNKDAKAVVITSPTYDGVISDVKSISEIAHKYNIPLIVDEAHGAMFFLEERSAVKFGADIVINSVHKTLPALTQTALIHINTDISDINSIRKYLKIYQTSSPSYILMGSIDYAVYVMEKYGQQLYGEYRIRRDGFVNEVQNLKNLKILNKEVLIKEGAFDFDDSKIILSATKKITGKELFNILRNRYFLEPEMAAGEYVLLMTTVFDTDEGMNRLKNALYEIDKLLSEDDSLALDIINSDKEDTDNHYKNAEHIKQIRKLVGEKSPFSVFAYPPGIPIIAEGEIVEEDRIKEIERVVNLNLDMKWI